MDLTRFLGRMWDCVVESVMMKPRGDVEVLNVSD